MTISGYTEIQQPFNWDPQSEALVNPDNGLAGYIKDKMSEVPVTFKGNKSKRVSLTFKVTQGNKERTEHFAAYLRANGQIEIKSKRWSRLPDWLSVRFVRDTPKSRALTGFFNQSEQVQEFTNGILNHRTASRSPVNRHIQHRGYHPLTAGPRINAGGEDNGTELKTTGQFELDATKNEQQEELPSEEADELFGYRHPNLNSNEPVVEKYGIYSAADIQAFRNVEEFLGQFKWEDAIVIEKHDKARISVQIMSKEKLMTQYCRKNGASDMSQRASVSKQLRDQSAGILLSIIKAGGLDHADALATLKTTIKKQNVRGAYDHLQNGGFDPDYLQVGIVRDLFTMLREKSQTKEETKTKA